MTPEEEADYRLNVHWPGRAVMVQREKILVDAMEKVISNTEVAYVKIVLGQAIDKAKAHKSTL